MDRLVAVVGPTGVGKSQLAMLIAMEFDAEIVSADSRQVYRHMDIGTAKPTVKDRESVPHHLIDIVDPDHTFSLAEYQQLAYQAIANVQARERLPLVVGGTGQYVWALVEGWQIPRVAPDNELRAALLKRAEGGDSEGLYQELFQIDPVAASRIDPRNIRRVIRAIEVTKTIQAPFSSLQGKEAPHFDTIVIGLTARRDELYRRTDARVDWMIENELVEEVKALVNMGYGPQLPSMSGIGYREVGEYLQGRMELDAAIAQIKTGTHRFIRHQYNWFRLADDRIRWFDVSERGNEGRVMEEIRRLVQAT